MAPRKVTLKEFFQNKGYKTFPSESRPRQKKGTSLTDLRIRQLQGERSVAKAVKADKATYEGRADSGLKGPGPDYQGSMGYAGKGTKDRMPGTTPHKKKKRPQGIDV